MKATIVYHRVDADGIFSCLLVKQYLLANYQDIKLNLIGWNYGDPIPKIPEHDLIFLGDISFQPDLMKTLDRE